MMIVISPWSSSTVSDFPLKKTLRLLNKLITPLWQEIPLMQRCEADDDPRALDSL